MIDIQELPIYLVVFFLVVFVIISLFVFHHYFDSYVRSKTAMNGCGEDYYEHDTFRFKYLNNVEDIHLISLLIHVVYLIIIVFIAFLSLNNLKSIYLQNEGMMFYHIILILLIITPFIMLWHSMDNKPSGNKNNGSGENTEYFYERLGNAILKLFKSAKKTFSLGPDIHEDNDKNKDIRKNLNISYGPIFGGILIALFSSMYFTFRNKTSSGEGISSFITEKNFARMLSSVLLFGLFISFLYLENNDIFLAFLIALPLAYPVFFYGYRIISDLYNNENNGSFIYVIFNVIAAALKDLGEYIRINITKFFKDENGSKFVASIVVAYFLLSFIHGLFNWFMHAKDDENKNMTQLFNLFNEEVKYFYRWFFVLLTGFLLVIYYKVLGDDNHEQKSLLINLSMLIGIEFAFFLFLNLTFNYIYDFKDVRSKYVNNLYEINKWFSNTVLSNSPDYDIYFTGVTNMDNIEIDNGLLDENKLNDPNIVNRLDDIQKTLLDDTNNNIKEQTEKNKEYYYTVVIKKINDAKEHIKQIKRTNLNNEKELKTEDIKDALNRHIYNNDSNTKPKNAPSLKQYLRYATDYIKKEDEYVVTKDHKMMSSYLYKEIIERYNLLNNKNIDSNYSGFSHVHVKTIKNEDSGVNCKHLDKLKIINDSKTNEETNDCTGNTDVNITIKTKDVINQEIHLFPIAYISMYDGDVDRMLRSMDVSIAEDVLNDPKKNNEIHKLITDFKEIDDMLYNWKYKVLMAVVFCISIVLMYLFMKNVLYIGLLGNNFYNLALFIIVLVMLITMIIGIVLYRKNI